MNKESLNNDRISRTKIKSLNDSSIKPYVKNMSPQSTIVHSVSNKLKDMNKDKNKENEKINTIKKKPPIDKLKKDMPTPKIGTKEADNPISKIPHQNNRNKKDSNANKPLTAEITLSPICVNETNKKRHNSLNHPKSKSSFNKSQNDVIEIKLINSKLKNDIETLNEKIKTLQDTIAIKTNENEQIKQSYDKIISELQKELLREKASQVTSKITFQHQKVLKSVLLILIEICEIFLTKSAPKNSSTIQIENSVDVFESFNYNDDEKRSNLFEQIQGLLISKIGNMKKTLNISFDKELDRIHNWNSNINQSINIFSPLKQKANRTNEDILNSLSKMYQNSNSTLNDFDLSVSGNFYIQSPKFNSFDEDRNERHQSNSNISNSNNSNQKILQHISMPSEIVQMISNDSILNDFKNEVNIADISLKQINTETNNKPNEDSNCKLNVLECSIGDLVSPTPINNQIGFENIDTNKELNENMSNFTLDDVQNFDCLGQLINQS